MHTTAGYRILRGILRWKKPQSKWYILQDLSPRHFILKTAQLSSNLCRLPMNKKYLPECRFQSFNQWRNIHIGGREAKRPTFQQHAGGSRHVPFIVLTDHSTWSLFGWWQFIRVKKTANRRHVVIWSLQFSEPFSVAESQNMYTDFVKFGTGISGSAAMLAPGC